MHRWTLALFASALCLSCRAEPEAPAAATSVAPDPGEGPHADAPVVSAAPTPSPAPPKETCPTGHTCDYAAFDAHPRPPITSVYAEKQAHRLYLLSDGRIVKRYAIALGWGGAGPKQREGDGVTPTGTYQLTGHLATSPWHTLIGISYPNYDDVLRHARLKAEGTIPWDATIGFGIALHGRATSQEDGAHKTSDWTAGCIAVDNPEIEEIAALVKPGTPLTIVD